MLLFQQKRLLSLTVLNFMTFIKTTTASEKDKDVFAISMRCAPRKTPKIKAFDTLGTNQMVDCLENRLFLRNSLADVQILEYLRRKFYWFILTSRAFSLIKPKKLAYSTKTLSFWIARSHG
jgi:hypothetical protein